MINASVAIQVLPDAPDNAELCRIVDQVIDYIKGYGLKTEVGPFETTVEGDYDTLMELVRGCQLIACQAGAPSVIAYVKIFFYPEGGLLTIDQKITKYREGSANV